MVRRPESHSNARGTKQLSQPPVRPVVWIGSLQARSFNLTARGEGFLRFKTVRIAQGKTPLDIKPLSQFGSGVYELRESFDGNAYRMMYVVNLKKALYVLHAFMKKSKSGIGLPKPDAELIAVRLRRARELDKED